MSTPKLPSAGIAAKAAASMDPVAKAQLLDPAVPDTLTITIQDAGGNILGVFNAPLRGFSSGSVGFYASGKVSNPRSGAKYQAGINIVQVGSKG